MSILSRWNGFEEMELGGAAGEGDLAPGAEEAVRTEIAEVAVELEQQAAEIEEIKAAIDDQDEALEELEVAIDGMENLLGTGQFNSTAFAALYNRASKMNTKLGGVSMDRIGNESISDANTAQIVARQGIEGFMESVKGYAKKAIEVIKHVFDAIINFFVGLFSQADKLGRRAAQLQDRLTKTTKLKEKIKLGGWNVLFDYEKNGLNEGIEGWGTTLAAIRVLADVGADAAKVDLGKFNSAYNGLRSALIADTKKEVNATEKSEGSKKVLIGMSAGIRIHAEMKDGMAKDLGEAAEFVRSLKIYFGTGDAKKLTSGEVAAKADKAKLGAALTEVKGVVTQLRSDKVAAAFTKAQRDKVIGTLNGLKADDQTKADVINKQVGLVRAVYTSTSAVAKSVTKHMATTAGWTCDAVAAHL